MECVILRLRTTYRERVRFRVGVKLGVRLEYMEWVRDRDRVAWGWRRLRLGLR